MDMLDSSYCWFESDVKTVINSMLKHDEVIYWPISVLTHISFVQGMYLHIMLLDGAF